jgi:hypothetical protein
MHCCNISGRWDPLLSAGSGKRTREFVSQRSVCSRCPRLHAENRIDPNGRQSLAALGPMEPQWPPVWTEHPRNASSHSYLANSLRRRLQKGWELPVGSIGHSCHLTYPLSACPE